MQLRKEAWKKKFRTSTGFEPVTSRLPVRCSANWAMKPLTLGAGQLWVHMFPWKKWHSSNHVMYYHPLQGDVRIFRHHHHLLLATSIIKRVARKSRNDSCFVSFSSFRWLLCFNKDLSRKEHYVLITTMLDPLSPKSDQHEISPYNINAFMRIEDMIRKDESNRYFNKLSTLLLLKTNENLNFDIRVKRV